MASQLGAPARSLRFSPAEVVPRLRVGSAPLLLTVLSLLGLLIVVPLQTQLGLIPLRQVAVLTLAVDVLLGMLILKAAPQGFWSISFLLFFVLSLFHLGLYVRPALFGELSSGLSLVTYTRIWYTDAAMARAGVVVLLGLLAYGFGAGVRTLWRHPRAESLQPEQTASAARSLSGIADVGAVALLAGVGGWMYLSLTVIGPTFVLNGYLRFLTATADYPLSICYLLISVGTTLSALRPRRRLVQLAAIAFGVFVLLALMVGIRGEVLIPLTAALAVMARDPTNRPVLDRLRRPAARLAAGLALIGLLVGISFVQQVRIAGIQGLSGGSTTVDASALSAVDEMGYSIRVVITSVEWHEDLQEPYRFGQTYYSPPVRALARLVGTDRVEAATDYSLMNVEIANRVGPIGGSMIAEAEHNYGRPGVIAILGLIGAAAASATSSRRSAWGQAAMGIIGLMALMHVRNSFAPLFAWGSAALMLAFLGLMLSRLYPRFRE